jgi:hypothetical protein
MVALKSSSTTCESNLGNVPEPFGSGTKTAALFCFQNQAFTGRSTAGFLEQFDFYAV